MAFGRMMPFASGLSLSRSYSTPTDNTIQEAIKETVSNPEVVNSIPIIESIHGDSLWSQIANSEAAIKLIDPSHYDKFYDPIIYTFGFALDAIHLSTGLPWWGSIICLSVIGRLALTPIARKQLKATIIMERIRPIILAAKDELTRGRANAQDKAEGIEKIKEFRALMKGTFSKYGVTQFTAIKLSFPQIAYILASFASIHSISTGTKLAGIHEAFKTGGDFWFQNLTVYDPTYVLPALSVATSIITFMTTPNPSPLARSKALLGIVGLASVASLYVTSGFPAALHILWISSNLLFAASNMYMRQQLPSVLKEIENLEKKE